MIFQFPLLINFNNHTVKPYNNGFSAIGFPDGFYTEIWNALHKKKQPKFHLWLLSFLILSSFSYEQLLTNSIVFRHGIFLGSCHSPRFPFFLIYEAFTSFFVSFFVFDLTILLLKNSSLFFAIASDDFSLPLHRPSS